MSPASRHKGRVLALGCCICRRLGLGHTPPELHHVAEGSGLRSEWALVPLCHEHHVGKSGFHGMGTKGFCSLYHVPGESEYGLLVWLLEDWARAA